MNPENTSYSVLPSLQQFLTPTKIDPSPMMAMCKGLMTAQMNLSRLIMYEDPDKESRTRELVRDAMDVIADMYETFNTIEEERMNYLTLMETL